MTYRSLSRAVALLPIALVAACNPDRDVTAPKTLPLPGVPSLTTVDPGAEVNTTIAITQVPCGGVGTVTVTLQGVAPPPQDVPLDLLLVLDESGSIDATEWGQIRTAAISLLNRMDAADGLADGVLHSIRIGVVKFALDAHYDQVLSGNYTQVRNFLQVMPQRGGTTNITAALDTARLKLLSGGLPTSAKAVVFMTDGQATAGNTAPSAQLAAATAVKNLPARLFVVGVGLDVNTSLLMQMASPSSFVLIASFDALAAAFDEIANQVRVLPAARNVLFSATVATGFTLVPGSGSATKGSVTQGSSGVTWSLLALEGETVTLTFQIDHDEVAQPGGGTLTAVTNPRLILTRPISNTPFAENFDDVQADVVGCDVTPPGITGDVAGVIGENDWYVSDVTVSWSVVDDESTITDRTGCDTQNVDTDTNGRTFTCTATSGGGSASQTVTLKRDATAPTVTYSGNAGTYDAADILVITCTAADNLSGVASHTCVNITGPATAFSPGVHTVSATATDNAGNVGSGSTTFTVAATFDGLCVLVRRVVSDARLADVMCRHLATAKTAAGRGNDNAKRGALRAFINMVNAQSGKAISQADADLLAAFAESLM
jgi:von Willebrand factor type A domain